MNFPDFQILAKATEDIILAKYIQDDFSFLNSEEKTLNQIKREISLLKEKTSLSFLGEDFIHAETDWFIKIKQFWNIQESDNQNIIESFLHKILQSDEINLSFPNGLMGLLLRLSKENKTFKNPIIANFLNQSTKLLLSKKMIPKANWQQHSFFPEAFDSDTWTSNNILSWMVGDLHVVKFLYRQATVNLNNNYDLIAENIGMYAISRTHEEQNGITNSTFANGSIGLVVLFQALYYETRNENYQKASTLWLEKTKSLLEKELQNDFYNGKESLFLDGMAGVLYIVKAIQQEKPKSVLTWLVG